MNQPQIPNLSIVQQAEEMASNVVSELAPEWDRDARFPEELFDAMRDTRLNALTVPSSLGGLGLGPDAHEPDVDDPLTIWLVSKALARADGSSGHNQQNHTNVVHTTSFLGSEEQLSVAVRAVVEEGAVFGGWGSELSGKPPEQFTVAKRVPGGYKLYGSKLFSTNAGAARYANVFAYPEDVKDPIGEVMVFLVDTDQPELRIDGSWWANATGMRATVSHKVDLDGLFVRDSDMLGEPGDYWGKMVQIRYLPQFAANFQGVGEHVLDYGIEYLRARKRTGSEWTQRAVAEAKIALVTADLLLKETAELMRAGDLAATARAGVMLRAYSEQAVGKVIANVQDACGASIYMTPHPLERVLRDWQFYSRHESLNLILTGLGKGVLDGLDKDASPSAVGVDFHGER
jgi:alkylation response protein AidB-like acyl-CoA dehydrogenase